LYASLAVRNPWSYAELSEAVEAWGFRALQKERVFLDRGQVAKRWYAEEYAPVVEMMRQAELVGNSTEAEAYLRVARERYRLMRTHAWNDEVVRRLAEG
jgi:hypothetical protein